MTRTRRFLVIAAAVITAVIATSAQQASADVWPGTPPGNGPRQPSSSTGIGGGPGGVQCAFGTGWGGGQQIFDPIFYGCFGEVYSAQQIMFWGFEVWRFYGTADRVSGNTLSISYGTLSELTTMDYGRAWYYGYDFPAPHPIDQWGWGSWANPPTNTFLSTYGTSGSGNPYILNGRLAQVSGGKTRAFGSGDCTSTTTPYYTDVIRGAASAERDAVLGKVRDMFVTTAQGYPASMAATMANLRAVPSNPNNLEELAALWDDGVPCSSVFEYASAPTSPVRPQIVTCWVPTMRLGVTYPSGNTPYDENLSWRSGMPRYSDAYRDRLAPDFTFTDFSAHRSVIMLERGSRGWGPGQPYVSWAPLFDPGYDHGWAALAAARYAECQETTSLFREPPRLSVDQVTTSPSARVEIALQSPDVLQVGGAARPASFATSTRLICDTADCRPAGNPTGPQTVLKSSSHQLTFNGTDGYSRCANALSRNCDWFAEPPSAASRSQSNTVWFFRATADPQRFSATASNAAAVITRSRVTIHWSCPLDYGGDFNRCTKVSETTDAFDEAVTPSITGGPTSQRVVGATNDPFERR